MTFGKNNTNDRLWVGRSSGDVSDVAIAIGESISLDKELYREDIKGSLAHAKMLHRIGLLDKDDLEKILSSLKNIKQEIESNQFVFDVSLEDIHTHIEKSLIDVCGDAGRRLHTARSRNDQIAVDTHLYVTERSKEIGKKILELCSLLLEKAKEEVSTLLPGYTHLQIAQPIRLSHHILAHFWSFLRDVKRFAIAAEMAGKLPLGSGAFAGVNYETDREFLRTELGFHSIYPNSMDAVSSRDHILDFLYAQSTFMTHASRLAEEIILWSSHEFSFLQLPDHLTTGSSIMPQKKNPDLAELVRGKTGRVQSHLHNLFTNLKALPLTYNRDLQEDRFPLLDSCNQTQLCVAALSAMMQEVVYNRKNMYSALENGFATATDLADSLVQEKAIPFREAHHIVGRLVKHCVEYSKTLSQVAKKDRIDIHKALEDESFYEKSINTEASVEKKKSYGGTSLASQKKQFTEAKEAIQSWQKHNWREEAK